MLPYQPQHPQNYPVPNGSIPPGITETYMELAPKNKKEMLQIVGSKEKIFYAGMVDKINKHDNAQRRVLVITDKSVFNIDPDIGFFSSLALCTPAGGFKVKRKIAMPKVFGVTLSVNPTSEQEQFIIHVQGEYDYRYNGTQKREKIIKSLMNSHFAQSKQPFELFCRDEADLAKFHTTDDDLKEKKDKRPKDGKILVTPDLMQRGLDWIIFNRNNLVTVNVGPNNGGNMPHPNQGHPGGAYPGQYNGPNNAGPYPGQYNGPNNAGPYPQNQGHFPQPNGFQQPYNGQYGNNQPNSHMPGPQSYQPSQPYSHMPSNMNPGFQQPYPNTQPQPQSQGYYGQPNFNQNQNGFNRAQTMPNQPNNVAPNSTNNQAPIQLDVRATNFNPNNNNVQLNTNYDPSKNQNQFAPNNNNQYNGNYPPQNQNYGGPGNARNY